MKNKMIFTMIILGLSSTLFGQTEFKKPNKFYFSFGAGISLPNGITNSFYHDGSTNVQLGASYELAFHKRFSWLNGIELEQMDYNFDAWVGKNEQLEILSPIDQAKYTRIVQRNITAHSQIRVYLSDNKSKEDAAMFFQGGLRVSLTGPTNFSYRMNNERNQMDLGDFRNQVCFSTEFMVGFKNDFFDNFDLLNTSTLGFIYQVNPIFNDSNYDIRPVHFTWRFLF